MGGRKDAAMARVVRSRMSMVMLGLPSWDRRMEAPYDMAAMTRVMAIARRLVLICSLSKGFMLLGCSSDFSSSLVADFFLWDLLETDVSRRAGRSLRKTVLPKKMTKRR